MTFSNFEKYSAGKLNNHASEVDVDGLWNDILPHVQNDNRRRRGLIWFFFAGLLFSFVGFYTLTESDPSSNDNNITALSSVESIIEDNTSKTSDSVEKEIIATPIVEKENSNKAAETTTISDKKKTTLPVNNSKKAENQNSKYKATSNPIQTNEAKVLEPPINSGSEKDLKTAEKDLAESLIAVEAMEPIAEAAIIKENEEATPIETEELAIIAEEELIVETSESPEVVSASEEELVPPRNKFKIKFGVGVYGGLSSSFASLKDKDGMNEDYLQLRLGSEEQLETIQMGLDVVAKSKYGVYFKTGIQYSRIARKFSLNSDIVTIDSVDGIQKIYVNNSTMDTVYIYGPVPVTTTTTYNKITYNYFHLMDVPLLLGYAYNNDYWSFGVEAGALVNISTKTKGEIMQDAENIYDMKEDPLNWFKDNVGVSFIASISAAYQFNENLQMYIAPTARLESIFSTDANPIQQKHGSLGINLGVRYFIGY